MCIKSLIMSPYLYTANTPQETDKLGAALAAVVPDGMTIGLCGTLGAGKTRLVQALAEAIGVPREHVVSPTFVLCQHYQSERTIYHLDVYRLHDEDEFLELGPEEYFDAPAITVIEWADRVESCLPPQRLMIEIEVTGDQARQFTIEPHGDLARSTVAALQGLVEEESTE